MVGRKRKRVEVAKMDYLIDKEANRLIYLYKLKKGACPSSFGLNIAQIAGLPQKVLDKAYFKSVEFKKRYSFLHLKEINHADAEEK